MMTIEEQSVSGQNLDSFKSILEDLPVSRAAPKKNESESNSIDADKVMSSENKAADGDKDENPIIVLNDTLPDDIEVNADQEVPVAKLSRERSSISPVSALMEYSQIDRHGRAVIWDEFSKNGLFGCKVNFGENFWIVPAQYSRKKEARTMVALMACTELIGSNLLYENIELKKYESWTKESVRKMSDDLAKTLELERPKDDMITSINSGLKCSQQPESTSINKCTTPSDDTVSYVSLVNEVCQKRQINLPDYVLSTENYGPTLKFRCSVENFSGCENFCSDAMPSKKSAKNEVAKQIYAHLLSIGKLESIPKPMKKQNVPDLSQSSNQIISFIKNVNNIASDETINPVLLMPLVMNLVTHFSRSLYPEKSTFDGIYEMIDQWKDYLDWKNQKNENMNN